MRTLKMLGLAAIAALGLMAFVGAGTASATVICKTNVSPCPAAWMVSTGTEISASLDETAKLENLAGTETLDTCTGGSVGGPTEQTGSGTETVSIEFPIGGLTWSGCTRTTNTVAGGTLEFHFLPGGGITITVRKAQVTVLLGVSCTYGYGSEYKDIGTIDPPSGGKPATVTINTIVSKTAGGFACPSEARWTAAYAVTSPNSGQLWATES
jgi:hypothetical protein